MNVHIGLGLHEKIGYLLIDLVTLRATLFLFYFISFHFQLLFTFLFVCASDKAGSRSFWSFVRWKCGQMFDFPVCLAGDSRADGGHSSSRWYTGQWRSRGTTGGLAGPFCRNFLEDIRHKPGIWFSTGYCDLFEFQLAIVTGLMTHDCREILVFRRQYRCGHCWDTICDRRHLWDTFWQDSDEHLVRLP